MSLVLNPGLIQPAIPGGGGGGGPVTVGGTAPIVVAGGPAYTVALDFDATRFEVSGTTIRPQLDNTVALQGLTSGAAAVDLLAVNASDRLVFGNTTTRTQLGSGWMDRRTPTAISYAVLLSDSYVGVTSTAAVRTITLPSAVTAGAGTKYYIADESGGAATKQILLAATAGLVLGAASIGTNYGAVVAVSNGADWICQPWLDPSVFTRSKPYVRAVAVTNVASLSGTTTIDGVALAVDDTVLLIAQSTGANNGPWVVQSGAWLRPPWFASSAMLTLMHSIAVQGGTLFTNSVWVMTNATAPTLGVTALTYEGRDPSYGVIAQPDNTVLLRWRRGTGGTSFRLINVDGAGNVAFGDTTVAATLLVGNNDVRITTTFGSTLSQSNIGISNTLMYFNMGSGGTSDNHMQMSVGLLMVGRFNDTSAAAPSVVSIRGSQPHSSLTNTASSGLNLSTGFGRGTAVNSITLRGFVPVASGTTAQSTENIILTTTGEVVRTHQGRQDKRTPTATNYNLLVTDQLVGVTSTAAARTITLPSAATCATAGASSTAAQRVEVKDESGGAGTNNVTVQVSGGANIDGAATSVINTNYGARAFYCDGTNWYTAS